MDMTLWYTEKINIEKGLGLGIRESDSKSRKEPEIGQIT